MNPRALPELEAGTNSVRYVQSGGGTAAVTLSWNENHTQHRPFPRLFFADSRGDGAGDAAGVRLDGSSDPDGDPIVDYQLQVSDRADMHGPCPHCSTA